MNNTMLDAQRMSEIAKLLESNLQGKGFALVVFDGDEDLRNLKYISNAKRQDMSKAFEALLHRWEQATPESN